MEPLTIGTDCTESQTGSDTRGSSETLSADGSHESMSRPGSRVYNSTGSDPRQQQAETEKRLPKSPIMEEREPEGTPVQKERIQEKESKEEEEVVEETQFVSIGRRGTNTMKGFPTLERKSSNPSHLTKSNTSIAVMQQGEKHWAKSPTAVTAPGIQKSSTTGTLGFSASLGNMTSLSSPLAGSMAVSIKRKHSAAAVTAMASSSASPTGSPTASTKKSHKTPIAALKMMVRTSSLLSPSSTASPTGLSGLSSGSTSRLYSPSMQSVQYFDPWAGVGVSPASTTSIHSMSNATAVLVSEDQAQLIFADVQRLLFPVFAGGHYSMHQSNTNVSSTNGLGKVPLEVLCEKAKIWVRSMAIRCSTDTELIAKLYRPLRDSLLEEMTILQDRLPEPPRSPRYSDRPGMASEMTSSGMSSPVPFIKARDSIPSTMPNDHASDSLTSSSSLLPPIPANPMDMVHRQLLLSKLCDTFHYFWTHVLPCLEAAYLSYGSFIRYRVRTLAPKEPSVLLLNGLDSVRSIALRTFRDVLLMNRLDFLVDACNRLILTTPNLSSSPASASTRPSFTSPPLSPVTKVSATASHPLHAHNSPAPQRSDLIPKVLHMLLVLNSAGEGRWKDQKEFEQTEAHAEHLSESLKMLKSSISARSINIHVNP